MMGMRIGVIDVVRTRRGCSWRALRPDGLVPLDTEKLRLSLGEEIERHGVRLGRPCRGGGEGGPRHGEHGAGQGVASLDVFLTAPGRQARNAAELVAVLSRAAGVQARVLTEGRGGHARLPRRVPHGRNLRSVASRSLRHRRRVDRDRRRQPGRRARLDRVGRPRIGPAHHSRRRPAMPRPKARSRSPARPRSKPRSPSAAAPARRAGSSARARRRPSWPRRCEHRRDDLTTRGRAGASASTAPAPRSSRPASSCSPKFSGSLESRCTSAAAGSARVPSSPRRSARRVAVYGGRKLAHDLAALSTTAAPFFKPRPRSAFDDVAVRAADDALLSKQDPAAAAPAPSARRSSCSTSSPSAAASGSTVWTQRTYGLDTTRRTPKGPRSSTRPAACLRPRASSGRSRSSSLPVVAVARREAWRTQDARHSRSSSGRSRDQLSQLAARPAGSQRISSTSSWGTNSPATARMRQ